MDFVPLRSVYTTEISLLPYWYHYGDIIMGAIASQITNLSIVYSTVYADANQRKHQSFAPLAFVRGIHRGPVNSPHKWPVTRKMFPFDDVIIFTTVATGQVYRFTTLVSVQWNHISVPLIGVHSSPIGWDWFRFKWKYQCEITPRSVGKVGLQCRERFSHRCLTYMYVW